MSKHSVFITIPWFYPAFRAGGPVQSITNMVNQYDEDTLFYIFCGDKDLNETALEHIELNKWMPFNAHTMVWYAGNENRSNSINEQIKLLKPDLLFSIGIFSWHFNMVPLLFSAVNHKLVSVRGMLHPGALSQKKWKKKLFLFCWKLSGLHRKVTFHASDEKEAGHIRNVFGEHVKVSIAANFPKKINSHTAIRKEKGALVLLSIALISPMKNHLLVLRALEQCAGSIEYHIIGPVKDKDYWLQCLEQVKKLPSNIAVQYHGEVEPQFIQKYLDIAQVFILPSKSENFGHAFYEALSAGKPVITSNNTPWMGLKPAFAGMNVETDVSIFKKAIEFFCEMGAEEFSFWEKGAEKYAATALDENKIRQQYHKMFHGEVLVPLKTEC